MCKHNPGFDCNPCAAMWDEPTPSKPKVSSDGTVTDNGENIGTVTKGEHAFSIGQAIMGTTSVSWTATHSDGTEFGPYDTRKKAVERLVEATRVTRGQTFIFESHQHAALESATGYSRRAYGM